jgi:hypothetical protein
MLIQFQVIWRTCQLVYIRYYFKFTGFLVNWLAGSLVHWFTGSLVHWFTGLLVYWFTGLLVYWFTGLLVYWLTGSLIHWFTGSLVYWFTGLLAYWFTGFLIFVDPISGRLEDLISTDQLSLKQCRFFILDEADGLLKGGYEPLINRLHAKIPKMTSDGTRLQVYMKKKFSV